MRRKERNAQAEHANNETARAEQTLEHSRKSKCKVACNDAGASADLQRLIRPTAASLPQQADHTKRANTLAHKMPRQPACVTTIDAAGTTR
jgi:hypothetical protein